MYLRGRRMPCGRTLRSQQPHMQRRGVDQPDAAARRQRNKSLSVDIQQIVPAVGQHAIRIAGESESFEQVDGQTRDTGKPSLSALPDLLERGKRLTDQLCR